VDLSRRDVIKAGAAGLLYRVSLPAMPSTPFKLKYAPHFGMFQNSAGPDLVDQLKFAADQGFTAWEDNGMAGRPPAEQEKLAKSMRDLGITMGVFVVNLDTAWSPTLSVGPGEGLDKFLQECKAAVEVAKRVDAKWMTVVPGTRDGRLEMSYQTANVVDALRRGAEIFEPQGRVMVLEALNPYRDHPGQFLAQSPQAFLVCRAVNSPSCKILFDIYHQQITEGNLIPNIDACWSEIGYFQVGDNPGRNEPTTGEINYRNVFSHIAQKGFRGVVGMEHGNSKPGKEGELAVIAAYRQSDS
jgi:hydroxypyruvate isomerase